MKLTDFTQHIDIKNIYLITKSQLEQLLRKEKNWDNIDKIYLNELSWGDIIRENTDLKGNINYLNNELDQIETENIKLKKSIDLRDTQIRALKLQREVKNTRLIMMTKERDDYKDKYQGHHGAYYHSLQLYYKEIDKVTKLQQKIDKIKECFEVKNVDEILCGQCRLDLSENKK